MAKKTKIQLLTKTASSTTNLNTVELDLGEPLVDNTASGKKVIIGGTAHTETTKNKADNTSNIILGASEDVIGSSATATENASNTTTNTALYLNHIDNGIRSSHKIEAAGAKLTKTDDGLKIDATHTLTSNADGSIELKDANAQNHGTISIASGSTYGVVKAGSNINVNSGEISVNDGTTTQKGLVQLTTATDSTDETTAATPNSVKTAYDKAVEAINKINALDVSDVVADGYSTSFITQVTQTDGKISAAKATVPTASTAQLGIAKSSSTIPSKSTDDTGAVGSSTDIFARADHTHPRQTTANNFEVVGTLTAHSINTVNSGYNSLTLTCGEDAGSSINLGISKDGVGSVHYAYHGENGTNFMPSAGSTVDLGKSGAEWNNAYFKGTINTNHINTATETATTITANNNILTPEIQVGPVSGTGAVKLSMINNALVFEFN